MIQDKKAPTIRQLFEEGAAIDAALKRAARQVLLEHKLLGQPICVWEDGKVVWIPAEEIVVPDEPETQEAPHA
ncbi:MAG: hypothetical protein HS116_07500 [Planctomycetes bacterium]|nr:hypothetical protein [Planctomycetota bacterium]